jgi:SPP1 family predicted phage head-tail adaptor
MRAGKMSDRIIIQTPGTARSAAGAVAPVWADFARCWARIRPLTARERLLAGQLASTIDTEIEIRYREGITHGMRVVCGDEVYGIEAAVDPERSGARLVLQCVKGRPGD